MRSAAISHGKCMAKGIELVQLQGVGWVHARLEGLLQG